MKMLREHAEYDVSLSFAGEDRKYVDAVAAALRHESISVFYDSYEQVELWGKDLYQHLDDVYQNRARYCVVFLSKHYSNRLWTRHELKSAQARAFRENREYILPARFDDTELPGLLNTIGYIDLRSLAPSEFAEVIRQKIGPHESPLQVLPPGDLATDITTTVYRAEMKDTSSWRLSDVTIPTRLGLFIEWVLAVVVPQTIYDFLGLWVLLAPIWMVGLAILIVRFVAKDKHSALLIGGMAGALVGGASTFAMNNDLGRHGLVLGGIFVSQISCHVAAPSRRMNAWLLIATLLLIFAGLGVFEDLEYYGKHLPSGAFLAGAIATIFGIGAAALWKTWRGDSGDNEER